MTFVVWGESLSTLEAESFSTLFIQFCPSQMPKTFVSGGGVRLRGEMGNVGAMSVV